MTGLFDNDGNQVDLDDTVIVEEEFVGQVIFCNGGIRYMLDGSSFYLKNQSSLLYGDGGMKHVRILKKKGTGCAHNG